MSYTGHSFNIETSLMVKILYLIAIEKCFAGFLPKKCVYFWINMSFFNLHILLRCFGEFQVMHAFSNFVQVK